MHPRTSGRLQRADVPRAKLLLELVRERGTVHPREVDEHFAHGTRTNYWGGSSNVTTHLLDALHYRGQLRVARREKGIRSVHHAGGDSGRARRERSGGRGSISWWTWWCACTRRCRRGRCRPTCAGCATPRPSGRRRSRRRSRGRRSAWRGRRWTGSTGSGATGTRPRRAASRACACSRRSTPSSTIAPASRRCGAGSTASRRTCRRRSASSGTTRFRCCGATR